MEWTDMPGIDHDERNRTIEILLGKYWLHKYILNASYYTQKCGNSLPHFKKNAILCMTVEENNMKTVQVRPSK